MMMKPSFRAFVALAGMAWLTAACSAKHSEGPAVAVVNGGSVSLDEYVRLLRENGGQFQNQQEAQKRILESAVDRELLMQQAVKEGFDRRPDLAAQIQSETDLAEHRVRQEILVNQLLREKIGGALGGYQPTERDVQAYYQLNRGLPFKDPKAKVWTGPNASQAFLARQLLFDDKAGRVRLYEQARQQIAQGLMYAKQQDLLQAYLRSLRETAHIQFDPSVLAAAANQMAPSGGIPQGAARGLSSGPAVIPPVGLAARSAGAVSGGAPLPGGQAPAPSSNPPVGSAPRPKGP